MRSIQRLIPRCCKPLAIAHDKWMTADWLRGKIGKSDRVLGMTLIESARRQAHPFNKPTKKEFNSHVWGKVTMAAIGCCAVLLPTQSASAVEGRLGTVKACSDVMAGKCATGMVRNTTYGKQVQLPGGTWVDCAAIVEKN